MLLLRRPRKPSGFDDRMAPHRERVEASVQADEKPEFRPPVWQKYKEHFASAQHDKCGYCESPALATGVGDIDHFRPKSEISELDDDLQTRRRERPGLANVAGPGPRTVSERGYWWLAYAWENWLLACERCNRAWKGSLFPVAENPRPAASPDVVETPLLLDPYSFENPSAHLRFDSLGQVRARSGSRMGFETVRTLGLDRERLRGFRAEKAKRVHALVRQLASAEGDRLEAAIADILELGSAENVYAGMIRTVFEQETGLDWSAVEERRSVAR